MSEIQNNEGLNPAGNQPCGQEQNNEPAPGVAFKGEKTDLRFEPTASYKRTWINKQVRAKIGDHTVTFGAKQIKQVQKDLEALNNNPAAVQRASALLPAFQGYARNKGFKNPDSLALALEHYAATNEFVKNVELEMDN